MYQVQGSWIIDVNGRHVIFRGANVSGSSKVPSSPDGASFRLDGFYDYRGVSFVGRPFPLSTAAEHFKRLSSWGLRFIRLITTWEAVEHEGPGIYDREYLSYFRSIVEQAAEAGIEVYVDPHQDAWSRWTGGDGAPAWTLEAAGFDLRSLHASGAAILHQETEGPYPRMIWPTNYNRLACATMFTLFFGGDDFAPGFALWGEPAQSFLQGRFIAAMAEVAKSLQGLPNVVGFGPLNEPSLGFIGLSDASRVERALMRKGPMPSPFQAIAAGEGFPTETERWTIDLLGNRKSGKALLNPAGVRAWAAGRECPWRALGVWELRDGRPALSRPGHFAFAGNAADAYMKPFMVKFIESIRKILPDTLAFLEGVPNAEHVSWTKSDPLAAVNASHWYDGLTLITKTYQEIASVDTRTRKLSFGPRGIRRGFAAQVRHWLEIGASMMGGMPTLIGEFGLPFDLNGARAYRNGDFRLHERALSAYYGALDDNLASATIWNYTPDNDPERGDRWNDEDLSIYCQAQGGARALKGFCRPYAMRTAGTPRRMSFDPSRARFRLEFDSDPGVESRTQIFLPECWYPGQIDCRVLEGEADSIWDVGRRLLLIRSSERGMIRLEVRPGGS